MNAQHYIQLTLKTANGPETFGKFALGNDRLKAYRIFRKLRGVADVNEENVLCMDFIVLKNGLPLTVDMIGCTLDQLGENCKTITKELFKLETLSSSV